jgi:branched-chain amino acid transport system ATP-binding protein
VALLSLENVRRRFGGILAVNDVSFDVEAGQIVGLIGPNGAGKTTLFNLITRLYKPDAGSIVFDGESLLRAPAHEMVRRGIARTFQNVALFSSMSVLENVLVGYESRTGSRRDGAAAERVARDLLRSVGLADVADRPVAGLPFATLKRVEFARALAASPRLLLLDEPAGGLSHEEVEGLASLIERLRDELSLTVLLVEHHMNLVMRLSQTVHVLDFGRLIASGTPDEVRANPAVIEAYLGPAAGAAA